MAVYESTEQLYAVMNDLFQALAADQSNIDDFTKSNMVVRIIFEDPDGEILLTVASRHWSSSLVLLPGKRISRFMCRPIFYTKFGWDEKA